VYKSNLQNHTEMPCFLRFRKSSQTLCCYTIYIQNIRKKLKVRKEKGGGKVYDFPKYFYIQKKI
jgi:hypothetical protein